MEVIIKMNKFSKILIALVLGVSLLGGYNYLFNNTVSADDQKCENIRGSSQKIYHLPGSPNYNTMKNPKTFCSEQEAITAGYKSAGNNPNSTVRGDSQSKTPVKENPKETSKKTTGENTKDEPSVVKDAVPVVKPISETIKSTEIRKNMTFKGFVQEKHKVKNNWLEYNTYSLLKREKKTQINETPLSENTELESIDEEVFNGEGMANPTQNDNFNNSNEQVNNENEVGNN